MTDAAILIHLSASYGAGLALEKEALLVKAFAEKITNAGLPVFLVGGNAELSQALKKSLQVTDLEPQISEIAAVRQILQDRKTAHVIVFTGIFPLYDEEITRHLFKIHTEYRADITYGENLPPGIAAHIVSRDLLESLEVMEAKDADVAAVGVRAFVEKNINQFHAEVHYQEPDLRLLRLDFSLATARSVTKTRAFVERIDAARGAYAQLQPLIQQAPQLLHTFPSYIELEFSATTEYKSFFSPLRYIEQAPAQLSRANFDRVKAYLATGLGDTSVCASGLGEPLEHPLAAEFLSELLGSEHVRYLFIETNGIHLDRLLPLISHRHAHKLRVIVLLNSLEKYEEYSGAPAATLGQVKAGIKKIADALAALKLNAQEQIFVQAYKVEENETEIDALYGLADELGASFLFQKYNRYAGLMPERRVSDMTPLERYSCWHLRRDLFIRANGDIAFCKQTVDPKKATARGNLGNDDLADIWQGQRADFVLNYHEKYPVHLPCANCDEYFTFNF
jgi:spiro-SPASM protein